MEEQRGPYSALMGFGYHPAPLIGTGRPRAFRLETGPDIKPSSVLVAPMMLFHIDEHIRPEILEEIAA